MPAPQFAPREPQGGDTPESIALEMEFERRSLVASQKQPSRLKELLCWLSGHQFMLIPMGEWNLLVCEKCGVKK